MSQIYEKLNLANFDSQELGKATLYSSICAKIPRCTKMDEKEINANIREILVELSDSIKSDIIRRDLDEVLAETENKHLYDNSEIIKELKLLTVFLDQLGNMYFQGERQYQYRFGNSGEGRGVSFDLDGTIDAVGQYRMIT